MWACFDGTMEGGGVGDGGGKRHRILSPPHVAINDYFTVNPDAAAREPATGRPWTHNVLYNVMLRDEILQTLTKTNDFKSRSQKLGYNIEYWR